MSADAELALLGGLLNDASLFPTLDLAAEDFSVASCRQTWEAMQRVHAKGDAIDVITVAEAMDDRGPELATLVEWMDNATTGNIANYAELVKRDRRKRAAAWIGQRLTAGECSVDDAIRDLMALAVTQRRYSHNAREMMAAVVDYLQDVQDGKQLGISSGLRDLDECIGGFRPGDLYVVGARPAMGKTAWLLGRAHACNVPCGIISAEQGHEQMGLRLVAIHGRISGHRLRLGELREHEWPLLSDAASSLSERPIWINDEPAPTLQTVVRQTRQWQHEHGIQILFLDYIQRMKSSRHDLKRHEQIGEIVMGLKELARELQIPVVALSQVNREVENRANKRPGMADLKDSGVIEQEADMVATLYREEVYQPDTDLKGIAEIDVCKNRHGPTGVIRCTWRGEFMRFDDLTLRGVA